MATSIQLNYETHGPSDAPCILMVHGILSSRNHWKPNLPTLKRSYRVAALDLPAHGLSPAPDDPSFYEISAIVAKIEEIRLTLGIGTWDIVGQSFGAGIALHYTLNHPTVVRTCTITNANRALLPPLTSPERAGLMERAAKLTTLGAAQLRQEAVHPRFARYFPEDMRRLLSEDAEQINPIGYAHLLRTALAELSVRDKLKQITCPMLLINGQRERKFQAIRHWLSEAHPQIKIADLDGGHSINIENPTGFNRALMSFLNAPSVL